MPLDEAEKAQILSRIERLKQLIADLEQPAKSLLERAMIRDRMKLEVEATHVAIQRFGMHDGH